MVDHPLSKIIQGFDPRSYYAGVTMAFSEVVDAGCKRLALSSPYSREEAEEMLEASNYATEQYSVKLYVEPDLLVTRLFPRDVAKDKTVILIANNQGVLDEYHALKKLKQESDSKGNPDELEYLIARRFGELLSYDEETITGLIEKNG